MKNVGSYIWGLIGKIGPQLLYLGTNIILARYVTPEEFGMIGVLSIFFLIANTLMESGLGGSLIKEKEISKIDCSTIFVYNTLVSLIIYLILFFSAPAIQEYFNIAQLSNVCRSVSLVFVIASWGQIAQTLLFRNLKFKLLTLSSLISVAVASLVSVLLAVRHYGVFALVWYQLVQMAVYVALNLYFSKYKISFKFSLDSFKKLFSFGFFTTLVGVIETIYENLITFLFGKYLSIQKAGYLTQAKKVETASCNALVGTINSVSFPILTRLAEKEDKGDFINEAHSIIKAITILIVPLISLIAVYSDFIIEILFGKNWIQAGPYLKILVFVGIALIFETTTRNFLKASGYVKELLWITVGKRLTAIGILAGCIFLNPNLLLYGYLVGAIIGVVFNYITYISKFSLDAIAEIGFLLKNLIAPGCVYIAVTIVIDFIPNIILEALVTLVILALYYFVFVRLAGINIINKFFHGHFISK